MNQTSPILQVKNLKKDYSIDSNSSFPALQKVSFEATLGEILILMGPSGSGKSTLLSLLAGLEEPTDGMITFFNQNIFDLSDEGRTKLRRDKFGIIFQFFELHDGITCGETLELKFKIDKIKDVNLTAKVILLLEEVGLGGKIHTSINSLSRGEKQRVAIARALVNNPQVILADEPTGALDFETAKDIITLLRQIAKNNNSVLIISTHDYNIPQTGDRVLLLEDGKIIEDISSISRGIFLQNRGIEEFSLEDQY
ncbi:MAG: ABC transporter ATP-binding protein [Promethearchaeota archaeon]